MEADLGTRCTGPPNDYYNIYVTTSPQQQSPHLTTLCPRLPLHKRPCSCSRPQILKWIITRRVNCASGVCQSLKLKTARDFHAMGGLENQCLDWIVFEVGRLLNAVLLDGQTYNRTGSFEASGGMNNGVFTAFAPRLCTRRYNSYF